MPRPSSRDKLLAAGLGLIHRQGYTSSGVQEITDAAGVPKGSFYNHFPSKEALALAVLDAYVEAASPAFAVLSEAESGPRARIHRHFAMMADLLRGSGPHAGCLLGNLAAEAAPVAPVIRRRLARIFADWTAALAGAIAAGVQAGDLVPAAAPEETAAFLVNAWEGAIARAKVDGDWRGTVAFLANLDRVLG